jgi:putative intracellular protease/amidase
MLRGLEGRRVALFASPNNESMERRTAVVTRTLEQAGARIHVLSAANASDEDFHGAKYAALVLLGDAASGSDKDTRVVQLTREFLASDKPVAAFGGALSIVLEAGGAAGRSIANHAPLKALLETAGATLVDARTHVDGSLVTAQGTVEADEFATTVVREFSNCLEERELDEMSDQSFPASDPPATTPVAIGRVAPDRESDSRP